jgi:Ca-activated chloride channel family protein
MAASAVKNEFSVSTVGVGTEFNELLMTRIADNGTGNYYFLENPDAFAEVFQKEFYTAKAAAATSVRVEIPMTNGISLTDASGYPITVRRGHAVFFPGDFRSGQTRKFFLTFKIPTDRVGTVAINGINVQYVHEGKPFVAELSTPFKIACVTDRKAVLSSIDKGTWVEKVLKDDYNKLKQEVAGDIRKGSKKKALSRIKSYYRRQEAENAVIGSGKVKESLERDLGQMKEMVVETFRGAPAAVSQKQKLNSKSLQYDGYKGRRSAVPAP